MTADSTATKAGIPAEAGLAALQTAWNSGGAAAHGPVAGPAAAPEKSPALAPRSYLNLRAVPQIDQMEALEIFTMLTPGYRKEWKEQVRQLRTRLNAQQSEMAMHAEELQIVAISGCRTSGARHEIAANLALTMASLRDVRVLVIDAKLTAPDMNLAGPGLCEASRAAQIALPGCLRRITGTQLYLMPAGDPTVNPFDALDLRGLHELLGHLRSQFDWILLDCPGFDTPSDAMSLTMFADGAMVIVERERDTFEQVARTLNQIQGRRLLGTLLL